MCFVWIWEQTAIISLYSINWLVCIAETESVYCAVRTESLYIIQVMCFVWIWEQTAIISLYSINWLVFITETECVYCVVRTGSLYIIQVMCFVWIWELTAIISLYSINWLVFITETESVYCAVRAECKYSYSISAYSKLCAMAQSVWRRPLTLYARVRSQTSPCEICGGQSGTVTGSSVSIIPQMLHTYHHIHTALTRRTRAKSGNIPKSALSKIGERWIEK